jgi:peptidoglycan/LPS O-acetylase OafA/YrhL
MFQNPSKFIFQVRSQSSMSDPALPIHRSSPSRRHDLDALRAAAMLLGLVLHGALSFGVFPWIVEDTQRSIGWTVLYSAIHGFRMPLFFWISGYFTMMLWVSRGLPALLQQRVLRVLLPCLLGMLTLAPAMGWISQRVNRPASPPPQALGGEATQPAKASGSTELIQAILKKDIDELNKLLDQGVSPDEKDARAKISPIHWAAMAGSDDAVARLIQAGAKIDALDESGYQAIHGAVFLGRSAILQQLIEAGANPRARANNGDWPWNSGLADEAGTRFIVGILGLPRESWETIEEGREQCRTILQKLDAAPTPKKVEASNWLAQARGRYQQWLTNPRWNRWQSHLLLSPTFTYLWFLWFLCWLVPLFALATPWLPKQSLSPQASRWITTPRCWLWLLPLTMVPQCLMGVFSPTFGPDTSMGWIPQPHVLAYYAIFFFAGAWYYQAEAHARPFGQPWWLYALLSLGLLFPLGLATVQRPWIGGIVQVTYAWWMSAACVGAARQFIRGESRWIRYLSDSAYWLYLAHLPLMIALQAWVRPWSIASPWKFLIVFLATTALCLLSYQWLVRYTPIGWVLHGPRRRQAIDRS